MVYLTMKGCVGRLLIVGPTVDTYIKYDQFKHFSTSKCQNFELTARTLWILLLQYNMLKGYPSVPC